MYFNQQKDMLKQTFAFIFLGVLSCVVGDEEGLSANDLGYESSPFVVSIFKDKCPDYLEPLFCNNWNFLRYKEFFKSKQSNELTSENRTSGNENPEENSQEVSLESPLVSPENHLNKRFIVFRRRSPIGRGYKRGPGFRSWGGKRDPGQNFDKKSKFVSWGGKRDGEFPPNVLISPDSELRDVLDKRPKFQNWGGKRSTNELLEKYGSEKEKRPIWKERFYLGEPFKKHVPKRPQFQSWGGKRGLYPWFGFFDFFHSRPRFLLNGGEKRKFSSWGGKRFDDYEDLHSLKSFEENPKRHVFQNWGENRAESELDIPDVFEMKESESSEKTKQRDKRKVKANREDDGKDSNFDSSGDETREEKNRR